MRNVSREEIQLKILELELKNYSQQHNTANGTCVYHKIRPGLTRQLPKVPGPAAKHAGGRIATVVVVGNKGHRVLPVEWYGILGNTRNTQEALPHIYYLPRSTSAQKKRSNVDLSSSPVCCDPLP